MREWETPTAESLQIAAAEWKMLVEAARQLAPTYVYASIGEVWVSEDEGEIGSFWAADYVGDDVVVLFDGDGEAVLAAFERLRRYATGRLID